MRSDTIQAVYERHAVLRGPSPFGASHGGSRHSNRGRNFWRSYAFKMMDFMASAFWFVDRSRLSVFQDVGDAEEPVDVYGWCWVGQGRSRVRVNSQGSTVSSGSCTQRRCHAFFFVVGNLLEIEGEAKRMIWRWGWECGEFENSWDICEFVGVQVLMERKSEKRVGSKRVIHL